MALYRCLASVGFQIVFINAIVERSVLRCGLCFWGANLPGLPIKLEDADTGDLICSMVPPEQWRDRPAPTWMHSPIDNLEFPILPYEKQPLPIR